MPYPWSAGNVLTATDLNSALAAKYDSAPAINAQTGTTYTFVLADATAGKTITASNASASTYTVPPQSSVAFSAGALLRVTNLGAGVVTFAAGAGVTVTNTAGTLAQYQSATLVRTASDAWTVSPAGSAPGLAYITGNTLSGSVLSFNSCFTSAYDAYVIVVSSAYNSAGADLRMRLRASGVDASAASYNYQYLQASGGVAGALTQSQTSHRLGTVGTALSTSGQFIIEVFGAPAAQITSMMARNTQNNTNPVVEHWYGVLNDSTSYDGFSLFPTTGTFSGGKVRVYGYRNS